MNEMYNMGIVTHNLAVMGILGVIFINLFLLKMAKDIYRYRRVARIFTPIGSVMIGAVIFTGVVMMAAKHLNFTIENIVMILIATLFVFLEFRRMKELRFADLDSLDRYKHFASNLLYVEIILVTLLSMWMYYDISL